MKIKYYLYTNESGRPHITPEELPVDGRKCFRKFKGKSAKIEAISRISGVTLSDKMKQKDVLNYITDNLYGTPKYQEYKKILLEVKAEVKIEYLQLQDIYEVEFIESVNNSDIKILHLVAKKILGQEYVAIDPDPIIRIEKL